MSPEEEIRSLMSRSAGFMSSTVDATSGYILRRLSCDYTARERAVAAYVCPDYAKVRYMVVAAKYHEYTGSRLNHQYKPANVVEDHMLRAFLNEFRGARGLVLAAQSCPPFTDPHIVVTTISLGVIVPSFDEATEIMAEIAEGNFDGGISRTTQQSRAGTCSRKETRGDLTAGIRMWAGPQRRRDFVMLDGGVQMYDQKKLLLTTE